MKPTSKTPYEIRLELLQLAQVILHLKHNAAAGAIAEKNGGTYFVSTAATTEEIIAEAAKLNDFVSNTVTPSH